MHPIMDHILYKWKKGHSLVILFCGETNSGKSWSALTISEWLARQRKVKLDLRESVFTSMKDFIFNFIDAEKRIFIIDEAKKHLDAKQWWSDFNRDFAEIVATQRFRQNIYMVILPLAKTLAKDHREIINYIFEMKKPGIASTYLITRRWSELKKLDLWKWWLGDVTISKPSKKSIKVYKEIEKENKDKIFYDIIAKNLGKRFCSCGKKLNYLELTCPSCGQRWEKEDIYKLMRKKVKRFK